MYPGCISSLCGWDVCTFGSVEFAGRFLQVVSTRVRVVDGRSAAILLGFWTFTQA